MKEFQAVVMAAGRGSRMTEIVKGLFKCTLPVGNKNLVWYPLTYLYKNGFKEAIVIVPESFKEKDIEKIDGLKLDFVTIPSHEDWGTADSLRHIKDKITTDFLVVSCDLMTDTSFQALANVHRINDATLTILLSSGTNETAVTSPPGHKGKHRHERDIIGYEESSNRLILLNSEADIEEGLSFKKSLLRKHPNFKLTTNLIDAHLYLMKRSIFDILAEKAHISTIKGELLPFLLKKQFVKSKMADDSNEYANLLKEMSGLDPEKPIKCYAHIIKDGFCFRVNTLSSYATANLIVPKMRSYYGLVNPTIDKDHAYIKSRVGEDNTIAVAGENIEIAEKVSIRMSSLGAGCKIKEKSKILNSVLMNNVVVEEGAIVQGCIICSNTTIGKQTELKDCIVEKGQMVAEKLKLTCEVIEDTNELMEI